MKSVFNVLIGGILLGTALYAQTGEPIHSETLLLVNGTTLVQNGGSPMPISGNIEVLGSTSLGDVTIDGPIVIDNEYIRFPVPKTIRGTLINKASGEPAAGCRIELYSTNFITPDIEQPVLVPPGPSPSTTYSSDTGAFSFTTFLWENFDYHIEINDHKYQFEMFAGSVSEQTNDWGSLEVSQRPFYLENFQAENNEVTATVVNTTGKKTYMRFWLTGKLTRLDNSAYMGSDIQVPLRIKKRTRGYKYCATYRLNPGENRIKLRIKDYSEDIAVSNMKLHGGRSFAKPMMVSAPADPVSAYDSAIWPPYIIPSPWPPYITTHGNSSGGSVYISGSSSGLSSSGSVTITPR